MTREQAYSIVALCATAFEPSNWTAERAAVYVAHIEDLPYEPTLAGARGLITTTRWMPTIAEVRAAVPVADRLPSADQAWAEITREIRRVGYAGRPRWSAVAIGQAVDALGGWRQLCTSENAMTDRAHFLRVYEIIEGRARRAVLLPTHVRESLDAFGPAALSAGADR